MKRIAGLLVVLIFLAISFGAGFWWPSRVRTATEFGVPASSLNADHDAARHSLETRESQTLALASHDAAAVVAEFYRALTQPQAPTVAQERALIAPSSSLSLEIARNQGKVSPISPDIRALEHMDPMKRTLSQREQLEQHRGAVWQEVSDAGPVVLNYCRQHPGWFLPKDWRLHDRINISSGFNIVRYPDHMKDRSPPGQSMTLVWFAEQAGDQRPVIHQIVFTVVDGKIDPDGIWLAGLAGQPGLPMVAASPK